jgi:hypothetical protein
VYALERGAWAGALLARVLARLEELAQARAEGLAWRTRPELIPAFHGAPDGYDNLGVAHGVPGVAALLAGALNAGVEIERARALLGGAVRWTLAQDTHRGFPSWVGPGIAPPPSSHGWCYGDPGIAAVLHLAGAAAGEPAWERAALVVARRGAARALARVTVTDAGLCHGVSGVAHVLARVAAATGDEGLAEAARTLFARVLDAGLPGLEGPGLLEGEAGVGLALLAATSAIEPAWDRLLLLSTRRLPRIDTVT